MNNEKHDYEKHDYRKQKRSVDDGRMGNGSMDYQKHGGKHVRGRGTKTGVSWLPKTEANQGVIFQKQRSRPSSYCSNRVTAAIFTNDKDRYSSLRP